MCHSYWQDRPCLNDRSEFSIVRRLLEVVQHLVKLGLWNSQTSHHERHQFLGCWDNGEATSPTIPDKHPKYPNMSRSRLSTGHPKCMIYMDLLHWFTLIHRPKRVQMCCLWFRDSHKWVPLKWSINRDLGHFSCCWLYVLLQLIRYPIQYPLIPIRPQMCLGWPGSNPDCIPMISYLHPHYLLSYQVSMIHISMILPFYPKAFAIQVR